MPAHELIPRTGKWVYDRVNNILSRAATATGPTHLDDPYSPEGKSEADALLALRALYESEPPPWRPQLVEIDIHRGPPAVKHPPIDPRFDSPPERQDMSQDTFIDRERDALSAYAYNRLLGPDTVASGVPLQLILSVLSGVLNSFYSSRLPSI